MGVATATASLSTGVCGGVARAIAVLHSVRQAVFLSSPAESIANGQPCAAYIYVPRSGRRDGEPVTLVAEQEGPIWYLSRMVKDEYVRSVRGESSRFQTDDSVSKGAKAPLG